MALGAGIGLNVLLLGYFKYTDFFLENIAWAFGRGEPDLLGLALPLGISFFTFQQIAFLVDSYKGLTREHGFLNYCLFVSFFPQLIAGPIVHHKEMMPQFADSALKKVIWTNIYIGLFLSPWACSKRWPWPNTLAVWVNQGYADTAALDFVTSWRTSLCYTFQLYFDFSGYTDMAIGSARLLNIRIPFNFNSPYLSRTSRNSGGAGISPWAVSCGTMYTFP